ncbi:ABC-F family ATP-binding cassette domain-containing protein [Chitinimonas lacunae]|uniref:ABC-F family ATP-binding cassette domain-containing protein n=1 Tax=Chitinimonas lacunae TaxID=1963018 RepID=A0ABV8MRE3_9NEIS
MTTLISVQSLQLDTVAGTLFHDLCFTVGLGDRIGLIGYNGSGKSTLLALLDGSRQPSQGAIHRARQCRLQYVEQHLPARMADLTLYDALFAALDYQPDQQWRVDSLLGELGFEPDTASVPVKSLSGGQHTRLLLGRALLQEPNLLLLDEPSNHLDLPSLLWLERFLLDWKGGFILVSHDRRLLDNVTRQSWILRDQRLYGFDHPASSALEALAAADMAAAERFAAEQKEIDRLTDSSRRIALWARDYDHEGMARKAKSMQKRIDKLKEEQSFVSQGAPWCLTLRGQALAAKQLLAFEQFEVRPAAGLAPLFVADGLWLRPGDKVALLGANGSGKTSLLRQCWQGLVQESADPAFYHHPGAAVGYYDQTLQRLDDQARLADALAPFANLPEMAMRRALIAAGFPYSRHDQHVATLSGGERARLLFLGLSLASYHLLLLDEPTNHLDMDGKQELADALAQFAGGFLLVSHDRDLIERSCNRFWVVREGRLEQWLDAPSAYSRLFEPPASTSTIRAERAMQHSVPLDDPEWQLNRLCELEALLAADLARKPRQQRPQMQQQWRSEIEQLNQMLGLVG